MVILPFEVAAQSGHGTTGEDMARTLGGTSPDFIVELRHVFATGESSWCGSDLGEEGRTVTG